MTDERDDLDPADWFAQQFSEDEPPRPARRAARPPLVPPSPEPSPSETSSPTLPAAVAPSSQLPPVTPPAEPGGFFWGLTPGGSPDAAPANRTPPAVPVAPIPLPEAPEPPAPAPAPVDDWDTPTVASPVLPGAPVDAGPPTLAFPAAEVARQEFPGFGTPVDPALDGVTEVLGAQAMGLPAPEGEGLSSDLDSLFGEKAFIEYNDEPLIPAVPRANAVAVVERRQAPSGPRASMTRAQKVLLSVAGGLVAALALVALFLLGTRIAQSTPAPAVAASPSPSAIAPADGVGPVAPGDHNWSELLGGECINPYESPWVDTFTVVECGQPHPAQLVLRGDFTDGAEVAYPGVEELQNRMTALCTPPTVIDYAATDGATDILVGASFPADEQDWADGNRTYYCFVSREGGADFTTSIAVPQTASGEETAP